MGFWQGMNEGLTEVMAQRERQRALEAQQAEAEKDRELRRQEAAESRKFELDMFMRQIAETRRDSLLELRSVREQEEAEANLLTGPALDFYDRFAGMEDDDRVKALLSNPATAAKVEEELVDLEKERQKKGIDMPPLRGEVLLDYLTVRVPDTGEVKVMDVDLADIFSMDTMDDAAYAEAYGALRQPANTGYIKVKPEAYFTPDPKVLEEGRNLFDTEVLRKAQAELATYDQRSAEYADLKAMIDDYATENSAGRIALQDKYGIPVAMEMIGADNPYITSLEKDPQLYRYVLPASQISNLLRIANAPDATPEEKTKAINLLQERFGYTLE